MTHYRSIHTADMSATMTASSVALALRPSTSLPERGAAAAGEVLAASSIEVLTGLYHKGQHRLVIEMARHLLEEAPGEDVTAGTTVLSAGQTLTPAALGLAAALGLRELIVTPRPRVAAKKKARATPSRYRPVAGIQRAPQATKRSLRPGPPGAVWTGVLSITTARVR